MYSYNSYYKQNGKVYIIVQTFFVAFLPVTVVVVTVTVVDSAVLTSVVVSVSARNEFDNGFNFKVLFMWIIKILMSDNAVIDSSLKKI